jgi:hypothetical protein
MIGHLIGYSKTKKGYQVIIGDTVVTSVHVLFDESIPSRSEEYFKELDEAIVKVDPEERSVSDFNWLVGTHHMEDGLLYRTTRVVVRKGLIVGFRALVTEGKQMIEDKTPIHIADLQLMTEELSRRLHKKSSSHDGGTSGDDSKAVEEVTHPPAKPESASGRVESTSAQSEMVERKRVRTKRSLTNIVKLGEIQFVDDDELNSLLGEADSIWLTDDVQYREPETYEQSLQCPEADDWKIARYNERKALAKRGVMIVVRTPPGVKLVKCGTL